MNLHELRQHLAVFEPDCRIIGNVTQREIVQAIDDATGVSDAHDRTPGIWQNDLLAICLDKVAHTSWYWNAAPAYQQDRWEQCPRAQAQRLHVHLTNATVLHISMKFADSFVRALNMFWETRSRDLTPKI